ncbi:Alpha/Beta hydrolase protein [Flagelloscypha sp. PMI_526]|nr:Alpha/Beta hydrolase protein [Flagelloscypha sp. PMI_526]
MNEIDHPRDYALPGEEVTIPTSDGVNLSCYLIEQPKVSQSRATVIICHGNGMNHGDLLIPAREYFLRKCNVLTLSYRGYGKSTGTPTEGGLRQDAQAALDYLKKHPRLSTIPVVVYGLSLGGAVAINLTARNSDKVAALIVENTFLSLPDVVKDWPYIGTFSFLCHQKWNSARTISKIPPSLPILMLSGKRDEVVPHKHMDGLRDIASKRGTSNSSSWVWLKRLPSSLSLASSSTETTVEASTSAPNDVFHSFPEGFHANTFMQEGYWDVVGNFLKRVPRSES